jgi:predicted alpha/beta-fold hydrolase
MYHSGLTSDTRRLLECFRNELDIPTFLIGFSLGGNVTLKLAGESGATKVVDGFCAISPPLDLAKCVRTLDKRSNFLYAHRFLDRLRSRVRKVNAVWPDVYSTDGLDDVRSVWEFDDKFTAQIFGFGTAQRYYETQSANQFLDAIRVPTLVVCAEDDPLVPFEIYGHPAFTTNGALTLLATKHGGHLGFIARRGPRFWIDNVVLGWIDRVRESQAASTAVNF